MEYKRIEKNSESSYKSAEWTFPSMERRPVIPPKQE